MATEETPPTVVKSSPWWLQGIVTLGVPAAIALYLVWFIASNQTAAINKMTDTVTEHSHQSAIAAAAAVVIQNDMRDTNVRVEAYMRLLCVNGAKTTTDRNICLSVK
jgi:hypothetical protein